MANRLYTRSFNTKHAKPVLLDCNFIVDSTNGNGLGIRSLKGPGIAHVYMHTTATPAVGNPNPQGTTGGGTGSVNLGTAANFAIGAYSAITGSTGAGSVINGNMFITPNTLTSVTNFPPSVDNGLIQAANGVAVQAQLDATAAYTACQTLGLAGTTIAAELGGQTLTPGNYQSATSFGLSLTTGHSTLTFNGAGTYILYSPSTLVTGASGSTDLPVMAFSGGATANNTFIYWICGSSATINQSVSSAGATFYGTVIAQASVTATQAGVIDGRLIALTGAVTLSNTNTVNGNLGASGGGVIVVQLQDNYFQAFSGNRSIVSPVSGTNVAVNSTSLTVHAPYIITSLGTSTAADWLALGVPAGVVPAVGVSFVALASGSGSGSGQVQAPSAAGSGIVSIETVGDSNLAIGPDPRQNQGFGAQFILQCRNFAGAKAAPADGTVISLQFLLGDSSAQVQGG